MNNDFVFTKDVLLLHGFGDPTLDFYKRCTERMGVNFELLQAPCRDVSGKNFLHLQSPFQIAYGIPVTEWQTFLKYLDGVRDKNKGPIRIIAIPWPMEIGGEVRWVFELTLVEYKQRAILFYDEQGISWQWLSEASFLSEEMRQKIEKLCDDLAKNDKG